MKKKLLIAALAAASAIVCAFGIAGCANNTNGNGAGGNDADIEGTGGNGGNETPDENPDAHTHEYNCLDTSEKYLKSAADCTHKAVYYLSCECGEQGEETFEYGDFFHVFDQKTVTGDYLISAADCYNSAYYYYSCECGEKGQNSFSYGDPTPHSYTRKAVEERYLKSEANCSEKAVYCYSCKCGEEGEETFEYGEIAEGVHVYYDGECKFCQTPQIIPLTYKLNEDGESYGVEGYDKENGGYTVIIPSEYEGKPVTAICEEAFSLSGYGNGYGDGIKDVTIPDSVTSIGDRAFEFCRVLETVKMGSGVKEIGASAFFDCINLKNLSLPDGVEKIGESSFGYCTSLETLRIPDSLTSIGWYAFDRCDKLTYNEYDSAVYLGNETNPYVVLIKAKSKDIASCIIADTAKLIYQYAFYTCKSLESIVIPDTVVSIGRFAFADCGTLNSVTVGAGVKIIGDGAFSAIKEVYYNGDIAGWLGIDGLEKLISFYNKTKIHIGGSVPTDEVTIPLGVAEIPSCAFYGCDKITDVKIPSGVISIGESAFGDCKLLESVSLPEGVSSIGRFAFSGCQSLQRASIPDSATVIGEYAFNGCNQLQYNEYGGALYLGNTENPYHALVEAKSTDLTSSEINQKTKIILPSAYQSCRFLESIVIPESVVWIGERVFEACVSLESITVEEGNAVYHSDGNCLIHTADKILIAGCKNSVIPSDGSVTVIGNYAFRVLSDLTEISIPEGVTKIGDYAFGNCSSLTEVVLPDGLEELGDGAFYNCTSLGSVTIPESIKTIKMSAFASCSSLTDITFKGTKEQWYRVYKAYGWDNGTGDYTVHCTDGDIEKS